jgi:hypothetical protein
MDDSTTLTTHLALHKAVADATTPLKPYLDALNIGMLRRFFLKDAIMKKRILKCDYMDVLYFAEELLIIPVPNTVNIRLSDYYTQFHEYPTTDPILTQWLQFRKNRPRDTYILQEADYIFFDDLADRIRNTLTAFAPLTQDREDDNHRTSTYRAALRKTIAKFNTRCDNFFALLPQQL